MPIVQVVVNEEQQMQLTLAAKAKGLSVSSFVREAALTATDPNYFVLHADALAGMLEALRRGGQLAHSDTSGQAHWLEREEADG